MVHSALFIIYFLISLKILTRRRARLSLILSGFYIVEAIGILLNLILLWVRDNTLIYRIYFITAYFLAFGYIFILLFVLNLYKYDFKTKHQIIIIASYAISIILALNFPGGITINEHTDWRPSFSWAFLISLYLLFTCFIFIPTIILSVKTYKKFRAKDLKRKFMLFFIGVCGILFFSYGSVLYNTWDNDFFRIIYTLIVMMCIPSGLLIYYGIGRAIESPQIKLPTTTTRITEINIQNRNEKAMKTLST